MPPAGLGRAGELALPVLAALALLTLLALGGFAGASPVIEDCRHGRAEGRGIQLLGWAGKQILACFLVCPQHAGTPLLKIV